MEAVLAELPTDKNRGGEALRAHILGERTTLLERRDSSLVGVSKMARALLLLEELEKTHGMQIRLEYVYVDDVRYSGFGYWSIGRVRQAMAMLRTVAKVTGWEISRTCYDPKVWLRHLSVNNTHICQSAQTWSDNAQHERALAWGSRRDSEAQGQCEGAEVFPELKEKPGEALRATARGMDLSALEVTTEQVNREQGNKPGVLGIHAFKEIG